ncbi:bifunctional DNA primase/polymerase [Saccharothrix longispora]|uniref:bifunctional DNA primase/polymerase n=1 Tax=Saccharothrix longispora TaxID=33920 RepID=UPI0028FD9ACE|nr:bifunctional DNA primase/polymerase [Saccharothrix longispora]MDU0292679.1 bifunctional DNA primase/polymerase [Saccharothrix longispora]
MRAALNAAHHGHHVIPLWPRSKIAKDKGWESLATCDSERIWDTWSALPFNVGIACRPSGLYVLDLDDAHGHTAPPQWAGARHGRDVLARLAAEAGQPYPNRTYAVRTPSGGSHLYFQAPAEPELRNTIGRLGWRIDSRGAGGYIVAAGSVSSRGIYRPINRSPITALPQWLIPLLLPPKPPTPSRSPGKAPHHPHAYLNAIVTGEADKVRRAAPGQRHDTLLRAANKLGQWVGGGELDEHEARTILHAAAARHDGVDGWSVREAETTINDGLTWGMLRPRKLNASDTPRTMQDSAHALTHAARHQEDIRDCGEPNENAGTDL